MADTREELETIREINEALAKQVEFKQKLRRLQGEEVSDLDIQMSKLNAVASKRAEQIEILKESKDILDDYVDAELKRLEIAEADGKIGKIEADRQLNHLIKMQSLTKEQRDELAEVLAAEQEITKEKQKQIKAQQGGVAASKAFAGSIAKAFGFSGGLTLQLLRGVSAGLKLSTVFSAMGGVLAKAFGPMGMLAFAVTNMFQMAFSLDSAAASFAKITGQGRSFQGVIADTFKANSSFAVSLENASKAASDLFVSYNDFSNLGKESQVVLTGIASRLEKIGSNAQSLGKILNYLQYSLGQTREQAASFQEQLGMMSYALRIPLGAVQEQFIQLMPKLSLFRDGGIRTFKQVSFAAKKLGMDVRTGAAEIFNMVEGFQSFESAAEKVATMNLVLGGSFLNTYDMVMAARDPIEFLGLIQDGFSAAGRSLDDMGFYERKLLADDLGISFHNLQKVMKGQITPAEAMVSTEEKLADAIKDASTMMDRFQNSMKRLAPLFERLLNALLPILEGFASFVEKGGGSLLFFGGMIGLAGKLAIAMGGVGTAFAAAGTKAAKAGLLMKGAGLAGLGGMLGMGGQAAMEQGGMDKTMQYFTGGLTTLAGAGLAAFVPGMQGVGLAMAASGLGSIYSTATSGDATQPAVSRHFGTPPGGKDMSPFRVKPNEGVVLPPTSGAFVIPELTSGKKSNNLSEAQLKEMNRNLAEIKDALASSSGATTDRPIQVNLVLDRRGQEVLASHTIRTIDRNYNPDGSGKMAS